MPSTGAAIVYRAVEEPLRQLAANGGYEGSIVVQKVKELKGNMGFNVMTGEYVDMLKNGMMAAAREAGGIVKNRLFKALKVFFGVDDKGDGS